MGEREPGLTPEELPEAATWVIDDIESGVARLEDQGGRFFEVPASWLPLGAAAADVLLVSVTSTDHGAALTLRRDEGETQRRLEEAEDRLQRLRKRDPGGNINL